MRDGGIGESHVFITSPVDFNVPAERRLVAHEGAARRLLSSRHSSPSAPAVCGTGEQLQGVQGLAGSHLLLALLRQKTPYRHGLACEKRVNGQSLPRARARAGGLGSPAGRDATLAAEQIGRASLATGICADAPAQPAEIRRSPPSRHAKFTAAGLHPRGDTSPYAETPPEARPFGKPLMPGYDRFAGGNGSCTP